MLANGKTAKESIALREVRLRGRVGLNKRVEEGDSVSVELKSSLCGTGRNNVDCTASGEESAGSRTAPSNRQKFSVASG